MSTIPERLHHYTGQRGLIGIIERKAIWASQVQYLNDGSELTLSFELMTEYVKSHTHFGDAGLRGRSLRKMHEWVTRVAGPRVFVASFTERGDLLSQWRGYCAPGDGFSIGLDTDLITASAPGTWKLLRCLYEPGEQIKAIDTHIEDHLARLEQRRSDFPDEAEESSIDSAGFIFVVELMQLGASLKHHTFSEEREWRLISPRVNVPSDHVKFRPGRHTIIPYFELDLIGLETSTVHVTVGPTQHPDLSRDAVMALLLNESLNYAIRSSDIPFRDW